MKRAKRISIRRVLLNAAACIIASWKLTPLQAQTIDFEKQIAPILVSHCLECHRGSNPEGGLVLSERALAYKGGDSGEPILAGHAAESLLWERVSSDEMPPKHPLSDAKKATLKQWIDQGANWGEGALDLFSITTDTRAGRDWWSLQPLRDVPAPALESQWGRNAIDAFVWRRRRDEGLATSPEAEALSRLDHQRSQRRHALRPIRSDAIDRGPTCRRNEWCGGYGLLGRGRSQHGGRWQRAHEAVGKTG